MIGNFRNRRRNFFIKKKFQSQFMVRFSLLVMLGAFVSGFIVYLTARSGLIPAITISTVITVILVGTATIIIALFTSHKIAGPLYRLEKDMEEISSGDLRVRVHLRKGDELRVFASTMDRMVQVFRQDMSEVKRIVSEKKMFEGRIDEDMKRLKEKLDKYKT